MLKLFKKGFAIVLSVCLVLMILPNAFAYTTASGTLENISWKLDSDGTLTISGKGEMPYRDWDSYPWYMYCSQVRSLVLEEGLTDVAAGTAAFDYDRLETVSFPSSVERIGMDAFASLDGLRTITIPGNVKRILFEAFAGCNHLESVNLNEGIEELDAASFASCPKLKSVVIPASVKQIRQRAFNECTGLQDITILNKDCKLIDKEFDIVDWSETIPVRTTIRGYSGSTAEAYAKRYGRTFAPIADNQLQTNDVLATLAKVLQQVLLQFMNFIRQFLAASAAQQTETQIQTTAPSANTAGDLSTILGSALAGFANLLTGMVTQVQNG